MPAFRFTMAECVILVAVVCAALGAMLSRSAVVAGSASAAVGVTVLAATVLAIVRRDRVGTYCVGFAVFAGAYYFATLNLEEREAFFNLPAQLFYAAFNSLKEEPLAPGTLEDRYGRLQEYEDMHTALRTMQSFLALLLGLGGGALARSNATPRQALSAGASQRSD